MTEKQEKIYERNETYHRTYNFVEDMRSLETFARKEDQNGHENNGSLRNEPMINEDVKNVMKIGGWAEGRSVGKEHYLVLVEKVPKRKNLSLMKERKVVEEMVI